MKDWKKKVLLGIGIILMGFALFNVAFLMVATILGLIGSISGNPMQDNALGFILLLAVEAGFSFLVLRSKLSHTIKAGFLCMPVMSVIVVIGVLLNTQPMLLYGLEGLFIGLTLGFLWIRKLPWQYAFAVLYCVVLGLIVVLFNVQI